MPHINILDHGTHTNLKITGTYSNEFRATIDRYHVETFKPVSRVPEHSQWRLNISRVRPNGSKFNVCTVDGVCVRKSINICKIYVHSNFEKLR